MLSQKHFQDEFDYRLSQMDEPDNYYEIDLKNLFEVWSEEICDYFYELYESKNDFLSFYYHLESKLGDEIKELAETFTFNNLNQIDKAMKELNIPTDFELSSSELIYNIKEKMIENACHSIVPFGKELWESLEL